MMLVSKYGRELSRYPSDKPTYFDVDRAGCVIKQRRETDTGAAWDVVTLDTAAAMQLLKYLQDNLKG